MCASEPGRDTDAGAGVRRTCVECCRACDPHARLPKSPRSGSLSRVRWSPCGGSGRGGSTSFVSSADESVWRVRRGMQCEAHFATLPSSGRRQQSKSSGLFMLATTTARAGEPRRGPPRASRSAQLGASVGYRQQYSLGSVNQPQMKLPPLKFHSRLELAGASYATSPQDLW